MTNVVTNPTRCWVLHVIRGDDGEPTATTIGRATFVRADVARGQRLDGAAGWQTADITTVLSDDGRFTLTLPNAAGADGVLHRRRFAILTDPDYEPGEEWLEFWTDARNDGPLLVGTPTAYRKTKPVVEITGIDLTCVLDGSFTSDTDLWDAAAPRDVIRIYGQLPTLAHGETLNLTDTAGGTWTELRSVTVDELDGNPWWIAEAIVTLDPSSPGEMKLHAGGLDLIAAVTTGAIALQGPSERDVVANVQTIKGTATLALRIVARHERIFAFANGELVAHCRRPQPYPTDTTLAVSVRNGTATATGLHAEVLTPFATRGASSDLQMTLPGQLPATGLRGQFFNAAAAWAQNTTTDGRLARIFAIEDEPATDRVEGQLAYAAASAPRLPGAFAARWSGAIYLDLEATDREIRLAGVDGNARLWIGKTLPGDEAIDAWWGTSPGTSADLTTSGLRAHLSTQEAGWYPIVIELANGTATLNATLQDREAAGTFSTVPQSRLSPLGVFAEQLRLEPHRQVIADIATAFGLQWRIEHRSLESGEFPGQISARELLGRPSNLVVDDETIGTAAEVAGSATDVVDGLLADGAGTAAPDGAGQLTVQAIDYERALEHLALRQAYESLADISEQPLLTTRVSSLLQLRSSPNEQVGVRPDGHHRITDTFPLTGDLALLAWQPGDGVRLRMDSIDVQDLTPRQMTTVQWPDFRPHGLGAPTVGFRQRPRSPKATLRRLTRAIYSPQRYWQGTLVAVVGTLGANTGASVDAYTRVSLPDNPARVFAAYLVVQQITGTGWRVEVTGTDLGTPDGAVSKPGRIPIPQAVLAAGTNLQAYARLIGGSGTYEIALELLVRV